ncbi:Lipase-GDSL domain-containing protein [Mycena chlorophos]|uniref:Lipase-GDSL domain-containing protein n=1 Tax=Mycena chlorophos TaxID=658473 RepID=A0A8H6SUU9_MYCCL|nr:Lipase-GDSL domain-containing protein [Mycena chlorophos]
MPFVPIASLLPNLELHGRWELVDASASSNRDVTYIHASWASASLTFALRSCKELYTVNLCFGPGTERKDRWNGAIPMLAVAVSFTNSVGLQRVTRTLEPCVGGTPAIRRLQMWPSVPPVQVDSDGACEVRITLIDWASVLEIEGFILEDEQSLSETKSSGITHSRILFIGDSISSGLSPDNATIPSLPHGVLDTYTYQCVAALNESARDDKPEFQAQVVAYPGIALCGENSTGMTEKFFWSSFWDKAPYKNMSSVASRTKVDSICIALGTNDMVSPATFRSALLAFIPRLATFEQTANAKIIFVLSPFIDFNDSARDQIADDLSTNPLPPTLEFASRTIRVVTVPQTAINDGLTAGHTLDGLHPTVAGHALIGRNLARVLREFLTDGL